MNAGMPSGVCVEKWIYDNPAPLKKLQSDFIKAGSQAVYAPTFGANPVLLSAYHLQDQVTELNTKLVEYSKSLGVPVGGTLCPTGLFVEPYGNADFDVIYDCYREQVRALDEAGVDFIVIETQTSLADMRAAVLAARTTNLPVFVTLTIDESGHTLTGGSLLPAVITLQAMGADAIGLNCSFGPKAMLPFLEEVIPHANVPIIAKPNAGVPMYETAEKSGYLPPKEFAEEMRELLRAGAGIVGGCCGTTPEHIAELHKVVEEFSPEQFSDARYEDADCYAAAIEGEAFFLGDDIVFSEPIAVTSGLGEDLIDLDDEQVNAALVEITSMDDAMMLARSASMSRLPIAVRADSLPVLDAAMRYFQGRLIVDTNCLIEKELIERISAKYGAIVY
jgi:5-methyltetrahydrofolate--homocysteine methyltransferase